MRARPHLQPATPRVTCKALTAPRLRCPLLAAPLITAPHCASPSSASTPFLPALQGLDLKTADGKKVVVASVDCTTSADVCTKNNVKGYPTLIAHKEGSAEGVKYNGARELKAMSEWIVSQ